MSFRVAEEQNRIVLVGQLTIAHAAEIREALVTAFQRTDRIALVLERDIEADLSFLQVLCGAYHTAHRQKKTFAVDSSAAPAFQAVMQESGFAFNREGFCDQQVKRAEARGGIHE